MKARLLFGIMAGVITFCMLTSCSSPKNKVDTEFDRVKKERIMEDENMIVSPETTKQPLVHSSDKTVSKPSDWNIFNTGEQKKIRTNENKIKNLKLNVDLKPKSKRKLTSLEKENAKIKDQIAAYDHELKPNWKSFKKKMDEKLNRINNDLSQLAIADKK